MISKNNSLRTNTISRKQLFFVYLKIKFSEKKSMNKNCFQSVLPIKIIYGSATTNRQLFPIQSLDYLQNLLCLPFILFTLRCVAFNLILIDFTLHQLFKELNVPIYKYNFFPQTCGCSYSTD